MNSTRHHCFWIGCIILFGLGCDTSLDPLEWDENWHLEQVCYTVYLENSHQPIQGATIIILTYDDPVCSKCPMDLQPIVTDTNGEVCITLYEGWTCDSAEVSAVGYISHIFTGKPPSIMYLSPIGP